MAADQSAGVASNRPRCGLVGLAGNQMVLSRLCGYLKPSEMGRLLCTHPHLAHSLECDRGLLEGIMVNELRLSKSLSLEHAYYLQEVACLFRPCMYDMAGWTPGPNFGTAGNTCRVSDGFLQVTGGTDWAGYHGVFTKIPFDLAAEASTGAWLQFQVRIDEESDSSQSTACVSLCQGLRRWGPDRDVFQFLYLNAEHGFVLRTHYGDRREEVLASVVPGKVYTMTMFLSWTQKCLSAWVDGRLAVQQVPFGTDRIVPPGRLDSSSLVPFYLCVYSWRARGHFSIKNVCVIPSASICPYFKGSPFFSQSDTASSALVVPLFKAQRRPSPLWNWLGGGAFTVIVALISVIVGIFLVEHPTLRALVVDPVRKAMRGYLPDSLSGDQRK